VLVQKATERPVPRRRPCAPRQRTCPVVVVDIPYVVLFQVGGVDGDRRDDADSDADSDASAPVGTTDALGGSGRETEAGDADVDIGISDRN
jgi:hypothetical protein